MSSSSRICPSCGTSNPPQAVFCFTCGKPLQTSRLSPALPAGQLLPNSVLKQRYRILSQIGKGGFGAVYKAEDTELGNRLVAVKEMSQQNGTSQQDNLEATEAFKREALMLADLMHPNLPRIYDHFTEAGHWYLVMDFIEGETLEDYLNQANGHRLPVQEALDIALQLCNVLSYLHSRQPPIIFRDLKPSNVMLTADGHVYLIDFGIARHFKPGQVKDTIAFGSPGYAAPEQYGKAQTTPQSDIYSLGATLHQLLTGDDPSETPFRFAPLQLHGQPTPITLTKLIMQMVEVDESKRPASMMAVKQELQYITAQIASGQFATASPSSLLQPARYLPPLGTVYGIHHSHADSVRAIAWSPDGTRVASAGNTSTIQVWDARGGNSDRDILTYTNHTNNIRSVAWSPDGTRIVSAGEDRTVQVWNAADGQYMLAYRGHSHYITSVDWSPDSTRIVSGGIDKTAHIWEAVTGSKLFIYLGHSDVIYRVAWSPDGQHIASGGYDTTVQIWNALTNVDTIVTYRGHAALVQAVAWSPDGTRVASGSYDSTVQVWDATTGKRILTYRNHSALVRAVAWSPDGTRIASCSWDNTVQIWDAATGDTLFTYRGHSLEVNALAWSPDGTRIASGGNDNAVQIWQAE
jgi:eukaryotic-like serine/threonine-protein kinase